MTDAAGHEAHQHLVALGLVELELLDDQGLAELLQDRRTHTHAAARLGTAYALAGAGSSWSSLGSQLSFFGSHQLRSPRSFIVAGRSTARTIVASIRIAPRGRRPSA